MNHPPSPRADSAPDIKITRWNLRRLDSLLASHAGEWSWRAVEYLARELMGQSIYYAARDGKPATISVARVLYQPEASRRVRLS